MKPVFKKEFFARFAPLSALRVKRF